MIGGVLMALYAFLTYISIEILNYQAGSLLPKDGKSKWRVLFDPESQLPKKYEESYRWLNKLTNNEPISAAGRAKIDQEVALALPRKTAEIQLRGVVGSYGLIQYPVCMALVPLGLILASFAASKKTRNFALVLSGTGMACFGVALYRSYFTSLGW
jgi:hypothetical protein